MFKKIRSQDTSSPNPRRIYTVVGAYNFLQIIVFQKGILLSVIGFHKWF